MPFNSDSYYRNKWRRRALESLAEARALKAAPDLELGRIMGADWNARRVESAARQALSYWRLYLSQCRICALSTRAAPYRPQPWRTRPD